MKKFFLFLMLTFFFTPALFPSIKVRQFRTLRPSVEEEHNTAQKTVVDKISTAITQHNAEAIKELADVGKQLHKNVKAAALHQALMEIYKTNPAQESFEVITALVSQYEVDPNIHFPLLNVANRLPLDEICSTINDVSDNMKLSEKEKNSLLTNLKNVGHVLISHGATTKLEDSFAPFIQLKLEMVEVSQEKKQE